MYQFIWENSFLRAYKKVTKNNFNLKEKIYQTLQLLSENPFNLKLRTHKLHGSLKSLMAASIDYEYRIIFSIDEVNELSSIILIDIGTQDEVY